MNSALFLLTGAQHRCLHDLFGVRMLTGNQTMKPPTAGTNQQSCSQTTGEQLRSQARLIDILTYCTFPENGLPCGNITGLPLQALIAPVRSRS